MTLEQVLSKFEKVRRNGASWMALCPAHADRNPSLSIGEKDDRILLHCFAGCSPESVLTAANLTPADLFLNNNGTGKKTSREVEAYDYVDEAGNLLYQVVRYEPKTFKQRKPDGKGGWIWNLNGVHRVLYNLGNVMRAQNVVVVEGEKDVRKAWELDLTATTNAGGAGKWKDEYSECLRGKRVTIIPDNDEPGRKHAEEVAKSLIYKAASVRICNLPENVKDLSEWPFSQEALLELIEKAPPWRESGAATEEGGLVTHKVVDAEIKALNWLWPERIPAGYISVFSGDPDVGKTCVAVDIIARYTTGREWPDGTPNTVAPGNVLMLTAEDGIADVVKPRLVAAGADIERIHWVEGKRGEDKQFHLDQDLPLLAQTLARPPGFGLVSIDPASSYLGKARIEKEQDMRKVFWPIKELCESLGVTCLMLGHFNKRSDVSALHRVGGAVANTGVPRAVWFFMKDPDGEKGDMLMLLGKGNFAKKKTGMRYRFAEKMVKCAGGATMGVPIIEWRGEETDTDADSATATARNPEEKASKRCEQFLRESLATDEKPSNDLFAAAEKRGISRRTMFRVKDELHIKARQKGGIWWWQPIGED